MSATHFPLAATNTTDNKALLNDTASYINGTNSSAVCINPHDWKAGYSKDNGIDPIGD